MSNDEIDRLKKREQLIDETTNDLERYENEMKELMSDYHVIQKEEHNVLEEVAYYSQGTVSETHALNQLDIKMDIERRRYADFEIIEDTIYQQKNYLREELEDTLDERVRLERQQQEEDECAEN